MKDFKKTFKEPKSWIYKIRRKTTRKVNSYPSIQPSPICKKYHQNFVWRYCSKKLADGHVIFFNERLYTPVKYDMSKYQYLLKRNKD